MASEVSTRNRLMTANQVEHDAAIDIPRRLARRNLKISQINLPHVVSKPAPVRMTSAASQNAISLGVPTRQSPREPSTLLSGRPPAALARPPALLSTTPQKPASTRPKNGLL